MLPTIRYLDLKDDANERGVSFSTEKIKTNEQTLEVAGFHGIGAEAAPIPTEVS